MEAFGMFTAIEKYNMKYTRKKVGAIMIKGICDWGVGKNEDTSEDDNESDKSNESDKDENSSNSASQNADDHPETTEKKLTKMQKIICKFSLCVMHVQYAKSF